MIIGVKATRSGPDSTPPAERYAHTNDKRKSRTPYAFALFLVGVGLYLKSIFPSYARQEGGFPPSDEDETGRARPPLDPMQQAAIDEDIQTGSTTSDETPIGSGTRLVDLQPPAKFILVDSPEVGRFLPPESPLVWSDNPGIARGGRAANDNSGGGGSNEGNGGAPPGKPGDGGEAGRPGDSGEPEGPEGPGEGQTPEGSGEGQAPVGPGGNEEPGDGTHGPCDNGDCQPVDPGNEPDCGCEGGPKPPPPPPVEEENPDDAACGCGKGGPSAGGNRAPRVSGPVQLSDVTGCAVLIFGLDDLLRYATDPDGGALTIQNLTTSSGTLEQWGDDWRYTAEPQFTGQVTLAYEISDGALSIQQFAYFSVVDRGFIAGTDQDDVLIGSQCADDIEGGAGDDHIEGLAGDDVISGGAGNDIIWGGDGNDVIFGGPGDDIIHGGAGDDQLWGGSGNDRIYGEAGRDIIFGEEGDDFLSGGGGDDIIFGGPGNDIIHGDAGDDVLYGGDGDDIIFGGDGDDVIHDGQGSDKVFGGDGDDHVIAALDQADDIYDGGEGHDTLDYSAATQKLLIDLVDGTARGVEIGNDSISGFEVVLGGSGNDHFIAGGASVTLAGGEGENIFEFIAPPTAVPVSEPLRYEILDFTVGDRIRMSKYDLFEKITDAVEDVFDKIYGMEVGDDDLQIRYRHEYEDMMERTVIEVVLNDSDAYDTSIVLSGHRMLVISETA